MNWMHVLESTLGISIALIGFNVSQRFLEMLHRYVSKYKKNI
jgi:hypothetical protein